MKRSRSVVLLAAVSALALASCDSNSSQNTSSQSDASDAVASTESSASSDNTEIGAIYDNMEACRKDYSTEDCQKYELVAQQAHIEQAPTYATQDACTTAHGGSCIVRHTSAGDLFMPAMIGFMVGRMLNSGNGQPAPRPLYYGAPRDCSSPGSSGCPTTTAGGAAPRYVYTGGGSYVGQAQSVGGSRVVTATPSSSFSRGAFASPSSVARGGFSGSNSVARGGFGGSATAHAGGGSS